MIEHKITKYTLQIWLRSVTLNKRSIFRIIHSIHCPVTCMQHQKPHILSRTHMHFEWEFSTVNRSFSRSFSPNQWENNLKRGKKSLKWCVNRVYQVNVGSSGWISMTEKYILTAVKSWISVPMGFFIFAWLWCFRF